jgi:hypothetical protein
MGHGRPSPLRLLWLALVWVQASLLGAQQAPPSPATQSPSANITADEQSVPAEVPDFRKQSHSHIRLERGDHAFDVYLFAPDENVDVLTSSFCGGDEGAKQFSGHFQLLSVADNAVVSKLDLDPDENFVEKKPHDGAHLIRDPKSGQDLVVIYQYGSCSSESVQFYSADPSGHLFPIPFLDRDGRTWKQMLTGSTGAIPHLATGALVFCSYDNVIGYDFCGAYSFDGANFLEAAKWMTKELETPVKGLDDSSQAARALFDFLSVLSLKGYSAAAYYMDPSATSADKGSTTANPQQKAAYLENYCTAMRGQCLMPGEIWSKPGADAQGKLLFHVSFQTSDFEPFKIGALSSFDFRVAKTPDGFKVLDLPPRVPADDSKQ